MNKPLVKWSEEKKEAFIQNQKHLCEELNLDFDFDADFKDADKKELCVSGLDNYYCVKLNKKTKRYEVDYKKISRAIAFFEIEDMEVQNEQNS